MRTLLHRNLIDIASSITIAQFGASLITVFVPLLLLQKGLAVWHICLFYAGYAVAKLLLNYPAMMPAARAGVRTCLTIGYAASAAYLVMLTLFLSDRGDWLLLVLPIFLAAHHAFVWGAQHLHISHHMDESRTGRDLAVITTLWQVAGVIAPLLGAGIALWLGQAWLAALAAACVLLAIIPVRRATAMRQTYQPVRYNLRGAPVGDLVGNFALCVQGTIGYSVWPIYLAIMLPNLQSIAVITTASAALAFVLMFVAGRRGDNGKNHRMLLESSALGSVAHLGRLLAVTPLGITLVSATYNVAQSYQSIPWSSLYYKHARARGINYIMSMEIACDLAFVVTWSSLSILSYLLADSRVFSVAFVAAALITWGCLLIKSDVKDAQKESPPVMSAGPGA